MPPSRTDSESAQTRVQERQRRPSPRSPRASVIPVPCPVGVVRDVGHGGRWHIRAVMPLKLVGNVVYVEHHVDETLVQSPPGSVFVNRFPTASRCTWSAA